MVKHKHLLLFFFITSFFIATAHTFYVPHYTQTEGEWETRLTLFNPTTAQAEIDLIAYGTNGQEAGRGQFSLAPGQQINDQLGNLLPELRDDRGFVVIETNIVELSGVLTFQSRQNGGIASLPLIGQRSQGLAFPLLEHNSRRQSGLVITNPDPVNATLLIETRAALARSTQIVEIGARGKWVGMLADLVPENTPAEATVTVSSEVALTGFALTFQNNAAQIFAVPGSPINQGEAEKWRTTVNEAYQSARIKTGVAAGYRQAGATPILAAAGYSDRENQIATQPDMRSDIGSITKCFTAAVLLILQERGAVDLDAPIATYLPDVPRGDQITTRMLLNHTSGLKNYSTEPDFNQVILHNYNGGEPWSVAQIVDFAFEKGFDYEPGQGWQYSNSGYLLASLIAETVSGRPLVDLYHDLLWQPLSMNDTFYGGFEAIPIRARAYRYEDHSYEDVTHLSLALMAAAGGIVSTNQDMLTWIDALFTGRVLSDDSLAQMLTPTPQAPSEFPYGLGVVIGEINGEPVYTHSGGTFGGSSNFYYFPRRTAAFSMLVNCNMMDQGYSHLFSTFLARTGVEAPVEARGFGRLEPRFVAR